MLSQELSTVLSGRYVLFNIYPLSYKEFTLLSKKKALDEETFWNYVKWGGLPNRCEFNDEDNIKDYLYSVFDSIILRDVVDRLGLKDTLLFNLLLQYVVDTTGREFSAFDTINDNYPKYVLSLDKTDFSRDGIIHKNIISWLLEK